MLAPAVLLSFIHLDLARSFPVVAPPPPADLPILASENIDVPSATGKKQRFFFPPLLPVKTWQNFHRNTTVTAAKESPGFASQEVRSNPCGGRGEGGVPTGAQQILL